MNTLRCTGKIRKKPSQIFIVHSGKYTYFLFTNSLVFLLVFALNKNWYEKTFDHDLQLFL